MDQLITRSIKGYGTTRQAHPSIEADIKEPGKCRVIDLRSSTLKLANKVITNVINERSTLSNDQQRFRSGRSCTDAVFVIRQIVCQITELSIEYNNRMLVAFFCSIGLEKALGRMIRSEDIVHLLYDINIPSNIIRTVEDIYRNNRIHFYIHPECSKKMEWASCEEDLANRLHYGYRSISTARKVFALYKSPQPTLKFYPYLRWYSLHFLQLTDVLRTRGNVSSNHLQTFIALWSAFEIQIRRDLGVTVVMIIHHNTSKSFVEAFSQLRTVCEYGYASTQFQNKNDG
ncbi:hypothetical protein HUJ05_003374 [Dendroctonus ponderosae]|nr:hypothetical protein HUJ05_003374 [Dendroctonus ponderosae]